MGLFSKKPQLQVCDMCGKADVEGCGHEFKHVEQISASGPAWLPPGLRAQGRGEYAWLCLHCNSFPAMKWPSEDAAAVALTVHLGSAHNKGRMKGMPQPFKMMSAG